MLSYLYTAKACSEIDQLAIQRMSLTEPELMARAACAAMDQIELHWPRANRTSIYCGPGNNGGDGYLLAGEVQKSGREVIIYAFGQPKSRAAKAAKDFAVSKNIEIRSIVNEVSRNIDFTTELVVDSLFGHGLERDISSPLTELFSALNRSSIPVFSLDLPSGVNSDTGAVMGVALKAQRTICFVAPKLGLYSGEGAEYTGKISHDNLAISREIFTAVQASYKALHLEEIAKLLPQANVNSHKGTMGRLGVIGGHPGMIGAAILAGSAAMRAGAGCVTVFSHATHIASVQQVNPVLMSKAMDVSVILDIPPEINALVVGPGLGGELINEKPRAWSKRVFDQALAHAFEHNLALVVDADGLNLLAKSALFYSRWVLTPHPKEAACLLQISTDEVQVDRPAACRQIAQRYGGVCVLKGNGSLVAAAKGLQSICLDGNWGMATAGSGDVLSGIIGAFLAAKLEPMDAALTGVYVHAKAGDLASQKHSKRAMIASDIIDALPKVFKKIEKESA